MVSGNVSAVFGPTVIGLHTGPIGVPARTGRQQAKPVGILLRMPQQLSRRKGQGGYTDEDDASIFPDPLLE